MWVRSFTISGLVFVTILLLSSCLEVSGADSSRINEDTPLTQRSVGSIAGTVLDARTGQATKWAYVTVPTAEPMLEAFTDQNGNFVISDVPAGIHNVSVVMMGYRTPDIDTVNVRPGAETRLLFRLVEQRMGLPDVGRFAGTSTGTGTILGRVYSRTTGHPLACTRIILQGTRLRALTDREGEFIVRDVPDGEHTVELRRYGYDRQYWKFVYVKPDSTTDVEFGMFRSDNPTGRITGRILNVHTKEPVLDASVVIESLNFGAWTDSSGAYAIEDLPPGHYTVRADADHFEPKTRCGTVVHADSTTNLGFRIFFDWAPLKQE